jgi:hypothetical protein
MDEMERDGVGGARGGLGQEISAANPTEGQALAREATGEEREPGASSRLR